MRIRRKKLEAANIHVELTDDDLVIEAQIPWPDEAFDAFREMSGHIGLTDREQDETLQFVYDLQLWNFLREVAKR